MEWFGVFVMLQVLAWMPAGMQMNLGGSHAHVQWFSCWKSQADNHDITL